MTSRTSGLFMAAAYRSKGQTLLALPHYVRRSVLTAKLAA